MRTILTALMLFCALVCTNAQTDLKNMTEQEFRKQKQEYLIKELAFTQEEAKEFFPLYEKFQKEKKQIYDENQSLMDRADIAGEEEYRQIINRLLDLQIMSDELEKKYYNEFSKILSYRQLFRLNKAEASFQKYLLKEMSRRSSKAK